MTSDEFKRLFLGPTLFRLDTILSPRLVPILYALGLLALLVWAVDHMFFMFSTNFGNGLWGLLEIIVYGLLGVIVLRIACEVLLVFFKAHEAATETVSRSRIGLSLLEEVNDAIHDLAEAEENSVTISEPVHTAPSPRPPPPPPAIRPASEIVAADLPKRGPTVRRTAKRTPKTPPAL